MADLIFTLQRLLGEGGAWAYRTSKKKYGDSFNSL